MAVQIMKMGDKFNTDIYEIAVDSADEIAMLPTTVSHGTDDFADMNYCMAMGSVCCVKGGSVYRLFSDGWSEFKASDTASGGGGVMLDGNILSYETGTLTVSGETLPYETGLYSEIEEE